LHYCNHRHRHYHQSSIGRPCSLGFSPTLDNRFFFFCVSPLCSIGNLPLHLLYRPQCLSVSSESSSSLLGTREMSAPDDDYRYQEQLSPFIKDQKTTKPATTYRPSSSSNGDIDHGKRQHELQHNFKVKILNKTTQKPVKLDPTTLQDKIVISDDALPEDRAKFYEQATAAELKALLRDIGLPATGKKPALVERLLSPTSRQRITPLHISDTPPSPTGSPKLKGGSNQGSPRFSPYGGSVSPRNHDHLSPRLVSNLSLNSQQEEEDSV
jgi:hypothetical protein